MFQTYFFTSLHPNITHLTNMFEAKLGEAALLKKIVEAIKDLVTDAPFDCTREAGISLQVCMY